MRNSNTAYGQRDKAVKQAIRTSKDELSAMNRQEKLIRYQIKLQKQQSAKLKGLKLKGLISGTTVLDRETKIAQAQEKSITAMVARSRLKGRLLDLQRELLIVKQKKETAISQKILKLERDISAQQITLASAEKAYSSLNFGRAASANDDKKKETSYEIVRKETGVPSSIKAEQFTKLWPGDIIIVK